MLVLSFLAKERSELIYSLLVMFVAPHVFPQVCWATEEMYATDFRHSNYNKILHSNSELFIDMVKTLATLENDHTLHIYDMSRHSRNQETSLIMLSLVKIVIYWSLAANIIKVCFCLDISFRLMLPESLFLCNFKVVSTCLRYRRGADEDVL